MLKTGAVFLLFLALSFPYSLLAQPGGEAPPAPPPEQLLLAQNSPYKRIPEGMGCGINGKLYPKGSPECSRQGFYLGLGSMIVGGIFYYMAENQSTAGTCEVLGDEYPNGSNECRAPDYLLAAVFWGLSGLVFYEVLFGESPESGQAKNQGQRRRAQALSYPRLSGGKTNSRFQLVAAILAMGLESSHPIWVFLYGGGLGE